MGQRRPTAAAGTCFGDPGLNPKDRAEWCTLVRRDTRLEPSARLLLLEIAEHIHRGGKGSRTPHLAGYCWASQATLAGLIGAGERMASAYIAVGKALGYIETQQRRRDTALIRLTWPSEAVLDPQRGADQEAPEEAVKTRNPATQDPHENAVKTRNGLRTTYKKTLEKTFDGPDGEAAADGLRPPSPCEANLCMSDGAQRQPATSSGRAIGLDPAGQEAARPARAISPHAPFVEKEAQGPGGLLRDGFDLLNPTDFQTWLAADPEEPADQIRSAGRRLFRTPAYLQLPDERKDAIVDALNRLAPP